jgi:hypothetical protein
MRGTRTGRGGPAPWAGRTAANGRRVASPGSADDTPAALTRAEGVASPDQSGCTHNALRLTAGPLSGVSGGSPVATPPLQTYGKRFESVECYSARESN